MLLMPNASENGSAGRSPVKPLQHQVTIPQSQPPSANNRILNWASVASWFLRPECSLLTTMASSDSGQSQLTRTTSVRLPTIPPRGPAIIEDKGDNEPTGRNFQAPTICTAIRCTIPTCNCECFVPGKRHLRYCETCKHGWVPHALDKLGSRHLFANSAPEPVQPNAAFDIASLVLYGCQALPIRLKILLDRLFSVLQKEQVLQVLHGFGWTPEDYARGYILQESQGSSLDKWSICSAEEEPLVLQQFLRFGETRAITQQLLLAQQALQDPALDRLERLERLERRPSPNAATRRTMSPNRCPSPSSVFQFSHLPTISPHQKHPLGFLNVSPSNGPVAHPHPLPVTCSSPPTTTATNQSPLNRLQNMQPFDFRKLGPSLGFPSKIGGDPMRRRPSDGEASSPMGLNLSMPTCLPPPPPPPTSSLNHPVSASHAAAMAAVVSANNYALVASSLRISSDTTAEFPSEDEDMEESSQSALNLSRDGEVANSSKSRGSRTPLLGRKSTTPTKRHWGSSAIPLNLGTQFINPATGKKRVQCNVCLKTFCDKGALKIHFSAVHLREMHKCTVEGCNMMFSSRRSRNRHSANPNPKLHSPHLRRKISPHDGRSAQAHPILIPPQTGLALPAAAAAAALNPLNPFGHFPLLTPPPDIRHHSLASVDFKQTLDLSVQRSSFCISGNKTPSITTESHHEDEDEDDDDDGIVVVGGDEDEEQDKVEPSNGIPDRPEDFSVPMKKQKMSISDVEEDATSNVDSNEDSLSVVDTQSLKDESSLPTNKRKRKSQNPIKCSVPTTLMEDHTTDGESSEDVFNEKPHVPVKVEEEDRNSQEESKDVPECDSPLNLGKTSPDVNANDTDKNISEIKTSLTPLFMLDKIKKEKNQQDGENNENNEENDERPGSSIESNKSDESFDSSNALRQLETLSQGHFGDLMSRGLHLGLGGQSSQFPPLGFMLSGGPPSPARSQASSAGSSNGGDSPDDNLYDNGQFISNMDVPIDKDNPRRCAACGKIFQNHFGVKTHYQNVHLKLMHKCNVEGCNAAFPSKRSRDRHSANLNLHRKLLSTSSDKSGSGLLLEKSPFASLTGNSLHGDILARIYAEEALKGHHLPPPSLEQLMMNGDRIPHPPLLLPPLPGLPFSLGNFNHFSHLNGSSSSMKKESGSNSPTLSSPPPPLHSTSPVPTTWEHCVEEDIWLTDKDGNVNCRICKRTFGNHRELKDHCERNHAPDMYKCTVPGCTKMFVSRTKRNAHAENETLHGDVGGVSTPEGKPDS
ncbi:zinc finger protein basonuclin-2-like isoform X2 [Onthophagus taurus]|uniref:zinc finger protein basonuclin-2-like isoform X2 n=1 Tax=Onthophagus taurus TaxID=166361 RepID=UPI000C2029B9|nr:zinc finger protein basonuclin-2-like isoform X2 [Onthophagus taurus]